jgi:F-type H+-transporting ATPase subunit b
MSRQSILVIAWVTMALFLSAVPCRAAQAPTHAVAHPAPGHPTAAEEAHEIVETEVGGGEGYPPNPLRYEPSLAIWTVVVFLGLLFVLTKFAWTPLLKALHSREEHFEHVLHETERARNESESLLAEHRRLMAEASTEVKGLLEKARNDAQANAEQIVKSAQAEAEASRDRAKREIVVARDQALTEIWSKTAELAVSVAGKVLAKQIGDDEHRRLIEDAISELPESTASVNGQGGHRA